MTIPSLYLEIISLSDPRSYELDNQTESATCLWSLEAIVMEDCLRYGEAWRRLAQMDEGASQCQRPA
jgi:hypothetical protein